MAVAAAAPQAGGDLAGVGSILAACGNPCVYECGGPATGPTVPKNIVTSENARNYQPYRMASEVVLPVNPFDGGKINTHDGRQNPQKIVIIKEIFWQRNRHLTLSPWVSQSSVFSKETIKHTEEMLRTALISNHKDLIDMYQKCSPNVKRFLEEAFKANSILFKPIELQSKSDWILSHPEPKQDFYTYYTNSHRKTPVLGKNIIYIQIIGTFGDSEATTNTYIHWLKEYCEAFFFGLKVKFQESVPVSHTGCMFRINKYSENLQIHTGGILKYLKKSKPKDAFCIVGITMVDLYPQDSWNFVFGQASLTEGMGIFSFARYDDDFYTMNYKGKLKVKQPVASDDYSVFDRYYTPSITSKLLLRSCKTLTHEIGHIFGMQHCQWLQCIMQGSNHLDESDQCPIVLCPICLRKLQFATNFDIKERFKYSCERLDFAESRRLLTLFEKAIANLLHASGRALLRWIEEDSKSDPLVQTMLVSHKPTEAFKDWKEWLLQCLQHLEE